MVSSSFLSFFSSLSFSTSFFINLLLVFLFLFVFHQTLFFSFYTILPVVETKIHPIPVFKKTFNGFITVQCFSSSRQAYSDEKCWLLHSLICSLTHLLPPAPLCITFKISQSTSNLNDSPAVNDLFTKSILNRHHFIFTK